ncbi:hypothetical protein KGQ19_08680 [Catenulispora sp. NL8]|uniref:Uncharacterized protein n=1 Tax=Catenulispora pinistramenti TaxID=2705254 RepID=A0ABS5KLM9_9ACTN|nr:MULTISPECIES: hypothetical protein [Catenulispora]MBS2546944.1 hypothetical protein [Catenulispora pinistramenti]
MMRDLISAFRAAAKDRMTAAGWRKRSGDIYTLDLGDGFHAWLGLNKATRALPLQVNPVVGLHYEPLEQLVAELLGTPPTTGTLSRPVGYLTPENRFLQLEIATSEQAEPAAGRLRDLVDAYGLPFARRYADSDALLAALRTTHFVANPDRKNLLIPALHLLRGELQEARDRLADGLAAYGNDATIPIAAEYQLFANHLTERLTAASPQA